IQAITAGMDSRMLLAATRDFASDLQYYVFDFGGDKIQADVQVASTIAKDYGLNFRVLRTEELTKEFKTEYSKEHLFPRFDYATPGIQYHYMHHRGQNIINVNGNCGEILRCYLGYSKRPIPRDRYYYYTRYTETFPFLKEAVDRWYDEAVTAAKENDISL